MMTLHYDFTARPISAWLTVNRRCNFRCAWCYAANTGFSVNDEMTIDFAKNIVDIIASLGIKTLTLTGGEPSLWKDLFEIIQYARAKNLRVGMITNARRFASDKFWSRYQQCPCDFVRISIKGVDDEQLQKVAKVRGKDKTLLGIERLLRFHGDASIGTVLSDLITVDDIKLMADRAKELGATGFALSYCLPTVNNDDTLTGKHLVSSDNPANELIEIYDYLDGLFDGNVSFDQSYPLCFFPRDFVEKLLAKSQWGGLCHVQDRSGLVFNTNGDILLCNTLDNVVIARYGEDFTTAEELETALNSQETRGAYREITKYPSEACAQCACNDVCHGGCIAYWTGGLDPEACVAFDR